MHHSLHWYFITHSCFIIHYTHTLLHTTLILHYTPHSYFITHWTHYTNISLYTTLNTPILNYTLHSLHWYFITHCTHTSLYTTYDLLLHSYFITHYTGASLHTALTNTDTSLHTKFITMILHYTLHSLHWYITAYHTHYTDNSLHTALMFHHKLLSQHWCSITLPGCLITQAHLLGWKSFLYSINHNCIGSNNSKLLILNYTWCYITLHSLYTDAPLHIALMLRDMLHTLHCCSNTPHSTRFIAHITSYTDTPLHSTPCTGWVGTFLRWSPPPTMWMGSFIFVWPPPGMSE